VSGSNAEGASGVYGTLGVPSTSNMPRARYDSVSWTDSSGNLWLFGGFGGDSNIPGEFSDDLNDLWEFNPTAKTWTWVSGSNTYGAPSVYGTLGVPSTGNTPGARYGSVTWTDSSGNLWLFGGAFDYYSPELYGNQLFIEFLNDLWEYSPTAKTWTCVSPTGTNGAYGTLGVPSASNMPGARFDSVSWTDSSGNLWLFGGIGGDSTGIGFGDLNDLWVFNPTAKTWTWVSGSNTMGASGVYGTLGVPSTSNVPGARDSSVSWLDSSGNLWLFGGVDTVSGTERGPHNDLWEFSPTARTWAWVSGSNTVNASGVYGTLGAASTSNMPGSRFGSVSWTDSSGGLWLFGGALPNPGFGDAFPTAGSENFNDLWEFSPSAETWTWAGGSNIGDVSGVYGTLGVPSAGNTPGARYGSVSWTDSSGNLWLFGGFDGNGALNDLWKYQP
jgi:N-acetylneuraminic acid mutarotase